MPFKSQLLLIGPMQGICSSPSLITQPDLLSAPPPSSGWPALQSRNTFSADYSDDEIDGNDDEDIEIEQHLARQDMHTTTSPETDNIPDEDEDEGEIIEIVKESIRSPSVEVIIPPPYQESIADSEYPDSDGDFSIDEPQQPQSSPLATSDEDEAHKSADAGCSLLEPLSVPHHPTTTSSTDPVEPSESQTAVSMTYSIDDNATTNHVAPDAPRQPFQSHTRSTGSHAPADIIMHDNSHVDQGYLIPPFSHDGLRAPSPSDAAMAKPRPAAQDNSPFLRFDPYGENHHQSEASTFKLTSTLPPLSRTPAWAGHNSILYDPMPQSTHYSNAYEFVGLDYGHVVPVAYRALESSAASPIAPSKDTESYDHNEDIYQDLYYNPSQHSKRKADEISDDAERSDSLPQLSSSSAEPAQDHSTQAVAKDEEKTSPAGVTVPVETAIIAVEVEQDDDVHPRKKMKIDPSPTQQRDRGKTFFKFAAATMAGFAIGTVGTIVGLASLPQDYFA